jgi:hypothetical protein
LRPLHTSQPGALTRGMEELRRLDVTRPRGRARLLQLMEQLARGATSAKQVADVGAVGWAKMDGQQHLLTTPDLAPSTARVLTLLAGEAPGSAPGSQVSVHRQPPGACPFAAACRALRAAERSAGGRRGRRGSAAAAAAGAAHPGTRDGSVRCPPGQPSAGASRRLLLSAAPSWLQPAAVLSLHRSPRPHPLPAPGPCRT